MQIAFSMTHGEKEFGDVWHVSVCMWNALNGERKMYDKAINYKCGMGNKLRYNSLLFQRFQD